MTDDRQSPPDQPEDESIKHPAGNVANEDEAGDPSEDIERQSKGADIRQPL